MEDFLILASSSPRRKELLTQMGVPFQVVAADVEELTFLENGTVEQLVLENARLKAHALLPTHPARWILGADTVVELEGRVFGKPKDLAEAAQFLSVLGGRTHRVVTGVVLAHSKEAMRSFWVATEVTFKPLSSAEIQHYVEQVPVLDKAGAYAAQQGGDLIIERMMGSRTNVIGLPTERLAEELASIAVS